MNKPAIVCVDDEKIILHSLKEQLKRHLGDDYQIEIAESGEEAMEIIEGYLNQAGEIPIVVADQIMPGIKGDELLKQIHALLPRTLNILLTGQANAEAVGNAINYAKLYRYIAKPWEEKDLTLTVTEALRSYFQDKKMEEQNVTLQQMNRELERFNTELESQVRARTKELEAQTRQLQESEERFRSLSEATFEGIIIHDQGYIVDVNQVIVKMFGYATSELIGESLLQFVTLESQEMILHHIYTTSELPYEAEGRRKDGSTFPIEIQVKTISYKGKNLRLTAIRDITWRKQAEQIQTSLYRISEAANTAQTLDALFPAIHEIVGELIPADNFCIALYDAATAMISFPYCIQDHVPVMLTSRKFGEKGLLDYVIQTEQPVLLSPETREELAKQTELTPFLAKGSVLYWLGVPLQIQDKTIGVLMVQSYTDAIRFREEEKWILMFVSTQIAMAIERKRATDALWESQEYARNIIDSSLDMIIAVDNERRIIEFNKAAQENLGYHPEEILGKHIDTIYADPQEAQSIQQTMREQGQCVREIFNRRKNGETFPCFLSASILRSANGEPVGGMGISRDITEQKKTEEALRESEEKYRVLFENLQDVFYRADILGNITLVSPSVERLLGYTPDEALGKNLLRDIYSIEQKREFMTLINKNGYVDGFEIQLKRKDDTAIWVSTNSHLYTDKEGKILGVEGIFRDITRRKQAQAELVAKNEELRKTLENLRKTQAQLLQAERMAALGQLIAGVAHEINTPAGAISGAVSEIDRSYEKLPEEICETFINLSSALREIYLSACRHVLFIDKTISTRERRDLAKKIAQQLSENGIAITSTQSKQLSAIGFSETDLSMLLPLFRSPQYPQIHSTLYLLGTSRLHIQNIKTSIEYISQLVVTLKQYSYLDKGTLVETDLRQDIDTTLRVLQNKLRTITVHKEYDNIPLFKCYASHLNQVWTHLIQNAIQAMNGAGTISIRLKQLNANEIAVDIEDTGSGIPDEILPKIFDPYFTTRSRQEKVIGMGLTISKQIVEQHQGRIEVVSSKPGNTCFRVTLPLSAKYPVREM